MDWSKAIEVAVTAGGSGLASFGGAFLRFKQRLKDAEDFAKEAKALATAAIEGNRALKTELDNFVRMTESNLRGWRLEFDGFKEDYARDERHRHELEEARAEARQSRPDPVEAFRHELADLKRQLERLRERQGTYVRNETFVEHTRGQEQQWKEIQRTLGRLEALAKL